MTHPFPDLPAAGPPPRARGWRPGPVFWAIAAGAALRLVLIAVVPLSMDEAYHVDWARHLQPGYFDHPPAVAWLMALPVRLCGTSTLALRLPALALQTLALAKTTPNVVFTTEPRPPIKLVPPITTAAMACNSKPVPDNS